MKNDANDFLRQMRESMPYRTANQALDVFRGVVVAAHESIVNGSPITGAPGQPVDTGALRASWQVAFDTPTSATISTNLEYAPVIEEGISHTGRPLTLRSAVGGFHSKRLTEIGMDLIVLTEVERVRAGRGR